MKERMDTLNVFLSIYQVSLRGGQVMSLKNEHREELLFIGNKVSFNSQMDY